MRIKAETETGSAYFIDTETGRWSKVKRGHLVSRHSRIAYMRVGDYDDREPHAFEGGGSWREAEFPEVGKCLGIVEGVRNWYVTTEIVDIVLNPEDWHAAGLDY